MTAFILGFGSGLTVALLLAMACVHQFVHNDEYMELIIEMRTTTRRILDQEH